MTDTQIIERLGGVKAISEVLGYNYTTVHNWLTRGISKDAKIAHPNIFMPKSIEDVQPIESYLAEEA